MCSVSGHDFKSCPVTKQILGVSPGMKALALVLIFRGLKASAPSGASWSVVLSRPFAKNANGRGTHFSCGLGLREKQKQIPFGFAQGRHFLPPASPPHVLSRGL